MGRKLKEQPEAASAPKAVSFPYWLKDTNSIIGTSWLVVGPTFCGLRAIARVPYMPGIQVGVVERVIPDWLLRCYVPTHPEEASLQSIYQGLKTEMQEHGASALAVQWLGELSPFSEKELKIMGDKLKTKAAPKADKAAPKADKPKGKGNPEALKKAREARAEAGPDVRKITVLTKDNPYREGSNRAASFAALKGAKTVQDYKDAGGAIKYIARWAEDGTIKLA